MQKIKIITDSCSDLPAEVLAEYDIEMIPTPVHFGEEVYGDRVDLIPAEFYRKLEEAEELPKTSMITPETFIDHFKRALNEGYTVLAICFSSELSGIFESAAVAKKRLDSDNVRVIDSKSASVGFGLSVYKAARAAREGISLEKIIEKTKYNCGHTEHIFAVGSLEMLKRGGRISRSKALIGNVLNIKPILQFDDGKIVPFAKVRGHKKMMEFLLQVMEERGHNLKNQIIGINHSANPELASELKNMIADRFGCRDFLVAEIGAAIGSHVGKNTVSVFFLNRDQVADIQVV